MKKNILISIIFIFVLPFLFSGCALVSEDQTNSNENNNKNENQNTNQNQNQNENTNIKENQNINENQEPESPDEGNLNTNQVSEEDTDTEIDTSDWLAYENEEYGISFKYPKEWELSELDTVIDSKVVPNNKIKGYQWFSNEKPMMYIYPEGQFDSGFPSNMEQKNINVADCSVKEHYSDTYRILIFHELSPNSSAPFRIEFFPGWQNNEIFNVIIDKIKIEKEKY